MTDEAFTGKVAEKLGELSGEKPLVGESELAEALGLEDAEVDSMAEALDELASASVAVQVGHNAEQGRMWRHTGMTEEDARAALDAERESARREAERDAEAEEIAAQERAAEIERERLAALDAEEEDGAGEGAASAPARARQTSGDVQRVELPMSVVGALSSEAVAEIVAAGVAAAKETGASFEFKVTA